MPVVARACQPLRRDRTLFGAGAGLERVEQREPQRVLQFHVSVDFDVRAIPELVEVGALPGDETVPSCVPRLRERSYDFVAERRVRAPARPGVREELHHLQALAGLEIGSDRHAAEVTVALGRGVGPWWPVDQVIHPRRHPQLAGACRVDEHDAHAVVVELLGDERRFECRGGARVARLGGRRLVATSSDWTTTRNGPSSGSTS